MLNLEFISAVTPASTVQSQHCPIITSSLNQPLEKASTDSVESRKTWLINTMCSLPPLTPSDPNELWYTPLIAATHAPAPPTSSSQPSSSNTNNHHAAHNHRSSRRHSSSAHPFGGGPQRTLLADLRQDESLISARKGNIRRFGAGWLKPPGIGKTLQGLWDEKLEREEAEQAALRDQALAEQQAAQEEMEREQQLAQWRAQQQQQQVQPGGMVQDGIAAGAGGMFDAERDLDDDIPEGMIGGGGDDDEDDLDRDDDDEEEEEWVSDDYEEDEDDGLENDRPRGVRSQGGARGGGYDARQIDDEGEGDYAHVARVLPAGMLVPSSANYPSSPGAAGGGGSSQHHGDYVMNDDMMMGMGSDGARDLDDDVPEAGSYEHTDTDADDDRDDNDLDDEDNDHYDDDDEEEEREDDAVAQSSDIEVDDETRASLAVPAAADESTSAILGGPMFAAHPPPPTAAAVAASTAGSSGQAAAGTGRQGAARGGRTRRSSGRVTGR